MKKICISKEWSFTSPDIEGKRRIDLPHDYVITQPRDKNALGGPNLGYFKGTSGLYEKYIKFDGKGHTILDIDGAYMCTHIHLNDDLLDMHPYGYTPYLVDLTDKIIPNVNNRLCIETLHLQPSSRWYSGGGVYRDVYLWTGGAVRIEPWDIFVSTSKLMEEEAELCIKICVSADYDCNADISLDILDCKSNSIKKCLHSMSAIKGKNKFELKVKIDNPIPWDCENPYMYKLLVNIAVNSKTEDKTELDFGIRTVSVDSKNGFMLNGKTMKLKGGCIHHDHAALGAAEFPDAVYRKICKLKEAGYNAVRSAHNPPSLALLEACDKLGIILMDEAFDMWNKRMNMLDYSLWFKDWWQRDISYMVLRDRNHPCVSSYSIGNEIVERNGRSDGAMWSKLLAEEVRKYDDTLPVTSGICGMWDKCDEDAPEDYKKAYMKGMPDTGTGEPGTSWHKWTEDYIAPLDMIGYNYLYKRYELDHEIYHDRVIWGSETHALTFYDSWQSVLRNPYVAGDFTWTAWDNLGEVGTGFYKWGEDGYIPGIELAPYPARSCYQGDFDLCGYRRPQSYFREAIWKNTTAPHIFTTHPEHNGDTFSGTGWHWYDVSECWSFDDKYIGESVKCEVYTTADEVLFALNGKNVGSAVPQKGIATINIPYERGEVIATAMRNGREEVVFSLKTTGEPYGLCVAAESEEIKANNRDLCYYNIYLTDKERNLVTNNDVEIECSVFGGELLCIYSGNPCNEDEYGSNKCHTHYGKALAVVRSKYAGEIKIYVKSDGLKGGVSIIKSL